MDQKPTELKPKTNNTSAYLKGMILGVMVTSIIASYLAIAPRFKALQKAWVHYKHVETLEFDEELIITKK